MVLAIPGTVVHWYLGHMSWAVTGLIALGSALLSYPGAKVALRFRSGTLERWYGLALTVPGAF